VIGAGGRALGVRFVERDRPASRVRVLREALRVLRRGGSILNFPEGTTTDGGALAPFHRGIFGIAQLADAPVVPIALAYAPAELCWTGGAAFVPHYAWAASRARLLVHVRFGEPLSPARPLDRLIAAARAAIVTLDPRRIHVPAARVRVPAPRPVAVLPAAVG
jgi:1-acyl-sn-glycerol-3-phosphate acyltransferase